MAATCLVRPAAGPGEPGHAGRAALRGRPPGLHVQRGAVAGPPRRAHRAPARGRQRAPRRLGATGRHLARAAPCAGAVGRPALLRAQWRGLARRGRRRLGQPVEHAHARCLHADHAAGRSGRRRLAPHHRRPQRDAEAGAGADGHAAGTGLAQGPDPGGLPQPGAFPRRTGGHRRAGTHAVRQSAARARRRGKRHRRRPGARAQCSGSAGQPPRLRCAARHAGRSHRLHGAGPAGHCRPRPPRLAGRRRHRAPRGAPAARRPARRRAHHQHAGRWPAASGATNPAAACEGTERAARRRRRRGGARQRQRRGAGLGRLHRRPERRRAGRHGGQPAPARQHAQALPVRRGDCRKAPHRRLAAARFAGPPADRQRPVHPAELRPPVQGLGQRAHRAGLVAQRAGGARRRHGHAGHTGAAARRAGSQPARARRLLRLQPGPGQRRGHAGRPDQRLPRARQPGPRGAHRLHARPPATRHPGAGYGRRFHCRRHPERPGGACRHLRHRFAARHPLLERRENRHQQGHARQLGRGLQPPLHRGRVGGQRRRRGHVGCERHQRRGARVGCADEAVARTHALAPARTAARRGAGRRALRRKAGSGAQRVVPARHTAAAVCY